MMKTLYIDSIDNHSNEENCISIHPSHLNFLDAFDKGSFDIIMIQNTTAEFLKQKDFFMLIVV